MTNFEKIEVDVPKELKEQFKHIGSLLKDLPADVKMVLLTRLVDGSSDKPTEDLEIGVNIICRALGYFEGEEQMFVLKQTLEAIMGVVNEANKES